tara:strand:+ start:87 stop:419 length:333 start_codon:yes stop_codon:yes gene_type:complete
MAEIILVNSAQNALSNDIQLFYTSPATGAGTLINAFTATNNTDSNKTYKAYIYDASATALDAVIPLRIIVRNRFDLGPSIVGQLIPAGGTLRMESSASQSVTFRVTGSEL